MMIKLYKKINDSTQYYESWNDKKSVVVHWGELGRVGNKRVVKIAKGETAKSVIERELSQARNEGFSEIDIDDHELLVISYKLDNWGNSDDLKKRHEAEDLANESLGWTGNGHCDGGEIGSGSIEIFLYVVDPIIATKTLVMDLRGKGLLENAEIFYLDNVTDKKVILYPS